MENKELNEYYKNIFLPKIEELSVKRARKKDTSNILFEFMPQEFIKLYTKTGALKFNTFINTNIPIEGFNAGHKNDGLEEIDFIVSDFSKSTEIKHLTLRKAKELFNKQEEFIHNIFNGSYEDILDRDYNEQLLEFCLDINEFDTKVINVFLFTNNLTCKDVLKVKKKEFKPHNKEAILINFEIVDIEDIFKYHQNIKGLLGSHENIELNINAIRLENTHYLDGYMAFIKGSIIASLYNEYTLDILQNNIRYFKKSSKNDAMKSTALKESLNFFAYNNGLSATVSSVEIETNSENPIFCKIKKVKGFQIVNGGQTTAILASISEKDEDFDNLSDVMVPIKITHIRDVERKDQIENKIAEFSNTQNSVKFSDLHANHSFFIKLQNCSNTVVTQDSTKWFLERKTGEYKILCFDQEFLITNPIAQKVSKVEVAKNLMCWGITFDKEGLLEQKPYTASKGNERNIEEFIKLVDDNEVNESFFKKTVALKIIRKGMENFLKGDDNRDQIFNYVISYVSFLTKGKINFELIWLNQAISREFQKELKVLTLFVRKNGIMSSRWKKYKKTIMSLRSNAMRSNSWTFLTQFKPKHKLSRFPELILTSNSKNLKVKKIFVKKLKAQDISGEIFIPKKFLLGRENGFFPDPEIIDLLPINKSPHTVPLLINNLKIDLYTFRRNHHGNSDTRFKTSIGKFFEGKKRDKTTIVRFKKINESEYELDIFNKGDKDYDKLHNYLDETGYNVGE